MSGTLRTGDDPSSKATLWVKAQHEGALPPPCIVRKDPRVPHTARRGACHHLILQTRLRDVKLQKLSRNLRQNLACERRRGPGCFLLRGQESSFLHAQALYPWQDWALWLPRVCPQARAMLHLSLSHLDHHLGVCGWLLLFLGFSPSL